MARVIAIATLVLMSAFAGGARPGYVWIAPSGQDAPDASRTENMLAKAPISRRRSAEASSHLALPGQRRRSISLFV